ncbi:RNA polymerase factor sigma-32 [Bradyrhizobium sp. Tv2a-2]|uniref:RNA polymerase factor sigma-32 n=1 Tax=Bradyrhizobium sp. Tv2a-2 TaxID=113395 RepID=UPI000466D6A8|nr:RNA polymerase factor sigma-32 [Bradyrhizobium sp. Tv2a-2]
MSDNSVAVAYKPPSAPDGAAGYARGYASIIKQYDLLERGQEQELARRWQDRRDQRASDALVESHLRLAARVARSYQGYGLPLADLIAEANLGLVMAAARFKPDHGARFSTYAVWWVKAAIRDYILRSWSLVRIGTTSAQRKLFFGLRREMRKFARNGSGLTPATVEAVAAALKVTPRDVIEMNSRLSGDLSLNAPVSDDGQAIEWEATLADESPDAETIVAEHDQTTQRARAVRNALCVLNERERRVFEARRLSEDPPSLEQLGRELSISNERVRQIEVRAFEKVKRAASEILMDRAGSGLPAALPAHA